MGKRLVVDEVGISERAADLTEDLGWGDGACPGIGILQQWGQDLAGMRMGDRPTQCSPQSFDAVGLRIVRGRVDQYELTPELRQQLAQLERALGRVDAQVVQQHQGDPSTRLGALDGSALRA